MKAARVAVDTGHGIARVIEASDQGLPRLAQRMEINVVSPEERERFAEAAQPPVIELIEERFGDEGRDMLDALREVVEASSN